MNAKPENTVCPASQSVPFLTGQLSGNVTGERVRFWVTFLRMRTSEIFKAYAVLQGYERVNIN